MGKGRKEEAKGKVSVKELKGKAQKRKSMREEGLKVRGKEMDGKC